LATRRHKPVCLIAATSILIGALACGQVMVGQGGAKLDASLQVGANGYNRPGNNAYGFQQQRYAPQNRQMAARSAQNAYIRNQNFHYSPTRWTPDPTIAERNRVVGRAQGPQIAQSGRGLDNNLQLGSAGYYNQRNAADAIGQQRYQPNNSFMRAQTAQNELLTYQTYTQHYSPRRQSAPESRVGGQTSNRAPSNRVR